MAECMICGADNATCGGHEGTPVKVIEMSTTPQRRRMPIQHHHPRHGVAGYKGDVELYDPRHPNLPIVSPVQVAEEEKAANVEPENKQRKTKAKDK